MSEMQQEQFKPERTEDDSEESDIERSEHHALSRSKPSPSPSTPAKPSPKSVKAQKWTDRLSFMRLKRKQDGNEPPPHSNDEESPTAYAAIDEQHEANTERAVNRTAGPSPGFFPEEEESREEEEDSMEDSKDTIDEAAVQEADDIINEMSGSSEEEEDSEHVAAEAEDILSNFTGSRESASSDDEEEGSDDDDDDEESGEEISRSSRIEQPSIPEGDILSTFTGSRESDSSDNEEEGSDDDDDEEESGEDISSSSRIQQPSAPEGDILSHFTGSRESASSDDEEEGSDNDNDEEESGEDISSSSRIQQPSAPEGDILSNFTGSRESASSDDDEEGSGDDDDNDYEESGEDISSSSRIQQSSVPEGGDDDEEEICEDISRSSAPPEGGDDDKEESGVDYSRSSRIEQLSAPEDGDDDDDEEESGVDYSKSNRIQQPLSLSDMSRNSELQGEGINISRSSRLQQPSAPEGGDDDYDYIGMDYSKSNRSQQPLSSLDVNRNSELQGEDIGSRLQDEDISRNGRIQQPPAPREFALGLGSSSDSDSSGTREEGMMHAVMSSDDDGDIALDELFETAAALDVTLETDQSVAVQMSEQEIYENSTESPGDQSLEVESNSSISCSTIEEEHTQNIEDEKSSTVSAGDEESSYQSSEQEYEENDEGQIRKSRTRTTAPRPSRMESFVAAKQPTAYSRTRNLLYDSDDDDDDDADGAFAPMPFFAAVPYSTGKRKIDEDGMSVVSDDIWPGIQKPVLGPGHYLPYTIHNTGESQPPKKKWSTMTRKKIGCLLFAFGVMLIILAIAFGVWLSPSRDSPLLPSSPQTGNNTNTSLPRMVNNSTPPPTLSTPPPTLSPTLSRPSLAAVPVMQPDRTPVPTEWASTATLSSEMLADFKVSGVVMGVEDGDRLGSGISMSQDGRFLAALSNSNIEAVQAYTRNRRNQGEWVLLPSIPSTVTSASGSDIATAITNDEEQVRVVAVSTEYQIEVYQFVDGAWTNRGQVLLWNADAGVSHTSMALSSDASTLAVGFVDKIGTSISVTTYKYDASTGVWSSYQVDPAAYRDATMRSANPEEGTILSMALTLSADGTVMTVEEWDVGSPQVIVQSFGWEGKGWGWTPMGDPLEFPYGPVSIALTDDGHRLAVVAAHPGKGYVFDWAWKQWEAVGGNAEHGFLPGGSSVALARDGTRILIGDSELNKASVYDYTDEKQYIEDSGEWSAWLPTKILWGPEESDFGTSVVMDKTGSIVGIGGPSRSVAGLEHSGEITFYESLALELF